MHGYRHVKKIHSPLFNSPLDEIIQLKKQEADLLGYEAHPYNALMNDYDKGLTVAITDKVFADLKPQLSLLLDKIKDKTQVDSSFFTPTF
ncbi:MAG: hypothetical protein WDM90_04290 [Ferruginibacter sp.]